MADSQQIISIYWLAQNGHLSGFWCDLLEWSCRGEKTGSVNIAIDVSGEKKFARLTYTITRHSTNEKDYFDYKIPIVTTPCHFGGVRYWFTCNATTNGVYCGRRVAKLYQGNDYFACRHCFNLTYQSRNESSTYRKYPFRELLLHSKIENIKKTIKKSTYGGKITKKQMRVVRLQKKILTPYITDTELDRLIYEKQL
jgi:hypothetical protein